MSESAAGPVPGAAPGPVGVRTVEPDTGWAAGRTVAVVGIYYAPDSTGIAPYTTDLCQTLARFGARVEMTTGFPHYPRWTLDPADRFRLVGREFRSGVRVTRVRHLVPRRQDVVRRGLYEFTFYLGSRLAVRGHRPDVVLGVTPNLAGAATAAQLANRCGAPLGIVVQDLVGLAAVQSGIRGGRGVAGQVASAEARILRRADRVAVISDEFVPPLVRAGVLPGRIVRMPNHTHITPSVLDRAEARQVLGWPVDRHLVVHTGNMGLKQGLDNVVEAARLAQECRDDLMFVLVGDGSTRAALRRRAAGLANLLFVDPLPDQRYPVALAAADCLLLNERASVVNMSMPSKLTSYLAAGRPVVAATSPQGAAAVELRRSGAGVLVEPDRPADLLAAVTRLLDDPERRAACGRNGRRYAADHLSEQAAHRRLGRFLRALCEHTPAGSDRSGRDRT